MRPIRILLVAIALVAVGLTGWALGSGDGYGRSGASPDPATTQAPPQGEAAAPADPAPSLPAAPAGDDPSGDVPGSTQPAPRPHILGIGSEPVYPSDGGVWRLPSGPGQAVLWADARNTTRVEFLLTPAPGDADDLVVPLGRDGDGHDGFWGRWRYQDRLLTARLTVRATGPGGTVERSVGVYHPDPEAQP